MNRIIDNGYGAVLLMPLVIVVVIFAIVYVTVNVNAAPNSQVVDVSDPWVMREVTDNCVQTEIFDSSGVIEYRQSDICQDVVLELRTATASEEAVYIAQRGSRIQEQAQAQAKSNLKSDPESGQVYSAWADDNVAQSQNCVTQMDQMLSNPSTWDALSPGARDTAIRNIIACVRHAEYINTKVVPNLFDVLVAEGIINVTD